MSYAPPQILEELEKLHRRVVRIAVHASPRENGRWVVGLRTHYRLLKLVDWAAARS